MRNVKYRRSFGRYRRECQSCSLFPASGLVSHATYSLLTNGCICCDLCGLLLQQRNAIKRDGLDLPVLMFDRGDHGMYTAAIKKMSRRVALATSTPAQIWPTTAASVRNTLRCPGVGVTQSEQDTRCFNSGWHTSRYTWSWYTRNSTCAVGLLTPLQHTPQRTPTDHVQHSE